MSSNVIRVNSDYKIQTKSGGTITLDTGDNTGLVFITGDLTVQGNTTTVNTSNMTIEDNIIILNNGESGYGVTQRTAGIEINRGTASSSEILWNEDIGWRDPSVELTRFGLFVFQLKIYDHKFSRCTEQNLRTSAY